ncbi:MAG: hypothetical protein ACFFCM_00695 [Promethearchaeota archaeon]
MSKISSKAFFLVLIIFGSYFVFNTLQFNNFNLISGLNLNQNHVRAPIDDIKILDSLAPDITNWRFNGTPFNATDPLNMTANDPVNISVTVTDDTKVKNVTLWYDTELDFYAGPKAIEMVPEQLNKSLSANETNTINGITLNYSNMINDVNATSVINDGIYHSYANGSSGILMAYALNLSNYNTSEYTYVYYVNISVQAFINSTDGVIWAGWQIWNNNTKQLDNIDGTFLNSTNNATDYIILYGDNLTTYLDEPNSSRIELFINITSTNPVNVSVDYIGFEVAFGSDNYTAALPPLPWERIAWDGQKWTYKRDNVEFWVEAFDYSGNSTTTESYKFNYSIIDFTSPQYNFTLSNGSYVGGVARLELNVLDFESGISNITLIIDENVTEAIKWDDINELKLIDPYLQNISVYHDWNVTDFENFNGTNYNSTHNISLIIWNRQGLNTTIYIDPIYIDNENPYGAYLNLRTNQTLELNATCLENATITGTILNATDFKNSISATYQLDNISHSYSNESAGILMAYAVELSDYNLSIVDNIYSVNISVVANVSDNSSNSWAGLQIWNWKYNNMTDINKLIFNSLTPVSTWFLIARNNLSDFIDENNNSRIEFFIKVNGSNPVNVSIDFIHYHVVYYEVLDVYSDYVVPFLTIRFGGFDQYNSTIDKYVLYANSKKIFQWNVTANITEVNLTIGNASIGIDNLYNFSSSELPNGELTLQLTVFDKAGNTNSTTFNTKIDNLIPETNFTSHQNNSHFTSSGSWNFIVPITFFALDNITSIEKVELYIDGVLGEVLPGQEGRVIEYDAFGNIIYAQENATWYEDGTFTYYWNASTYQLGSRHNLTLIALDIMGNSVNYTIWLNKTKFVANLEIEFVGFSTNSYVLSFIYVSFEITNTGNCTLFDIDSKLHFYFIDKSLLGLELGWISVIQLGNIDQHTWLAPNQSMTLEFLIYGYDYFTLGPIPGYFEMFLNVSARSIETFLLTTDKYRFAEDQLILSYNAPYSTQYEGYLPYVIVFLSAFGLGILLHILIRRIQIRSMKLKQMMAEKISKTKKK